MTKPICIFQSPLATRSGYGDMARDIARHLIDLDIFDLKIISTPWGGTPINALDGVKDAEILKRIVIPPVNVTRQPEVFIHATIPNEFMAPAKYNIGITAGVETTMCSQLWIEGCNRMNTVWGISNHAIFALKNTVAEQRDNNNNIINTITTKVPLDILHNCVHTDIFKKISPSEIPESVNDKLASIKEKFCFLFVGHWIKGNYGEDRKNVGVLIRTFCETFSKVVNQHRPALILKVSGANFSIMDREEILHKIRVVKEGIVNCPNVYLIHGDLTEEEMNGLYNHPKVKVHVSFTKGEGFGRPLLEATQSEKPIMASGWSGQLDFLNAEDAILLDGKIKQVEPGAVWENIIIPESGWFNVDTNFASQAMMLVFKDYDRFLPGAKRLAKKCKEKFNYDVIKQQLNSLLVKYVPSELLTLPTEVEMVLPSLTKSDSSIILPKMELPKLKKIEVNKNE